MNRGNPRQVDSVTGISKTVHVRDSADRVEVLSKRPDEPSQPVDVTGVAVSGNPGYETDVACHVETNQVSETFNSHEPIKGSVHRVYADAVQVRVPRVSVERN